ncbi:MAG: zf-HC2 domain-containing protein [Acidimicrobiia bacterium]
MSPLTCAQVREAAPELALGILGGSERAEIVHHVDHCVRCQAVVAQYSEAADALPLLAPEIEPPAGFEARTLARMGAPKRRSRRRLLVAAAVAAAFAAILSITVVRVVESNTGGDEAAPVAVAMADGSGKIPIGWAYVYDGVSVAIGVDYGVGVPDGDYTVRVDPAVGPVHDLGTITIEQGRGSFTGKSPEPLTPGSTISMIDADGNRTCQGTVA